MSLIAFITKMAVIPETVIANAIAIMAVIPFMTMMAIMTMTMVALMALMNILNMMASESISFTILHILVKNSVKDTVIMAAISITAIMATLDVIDIRVRRPLNVTKVTISLVGLVAVFHLITRIAVMM